MKTIGISCILCGPFMCRILWLLWRELYYVMLWLMLCYVIDYVIVMIYIMLWYGMHNMLEWFFFSRLWNVDRARICFMKTFMKEWMHDLHIIWFKAMGTLCIFMFHFHRDTSPLWLVRKRALQHFCSPWCYDMVLYTSQYYVGSFPFMVPAALVCASWKAGSRIRILR